MPFCFNDKDFWGAGQGNLEGHLVIHVMNFGGSPINTHLALFRVNVTGDLQ